MSDPRNRITDAALARARHGLKLGSHPEVGDRLLQLLGPAPTVCADGSIHTYDATSGLWTPQHPEQLRGLVQLLDGAWLPKAGGGRKPLRITATLRDGAISCAKATVFDLDFFADAPPGLAFRNGFVCATPDGIQCRAHAAENRARVGYGFDFEPDASTAAFDAFLISLFADDDDRNDKIQLIYEFAGICLWGVAPQLQQCIFLVGAGANGKSVLTDALVALFPRDAVTAIAPQDWGNEYYRAALVGKRLNALADIPNRDITASSDFKAVVAGDQLTARPIRREVIQFRTQAGHLFSANELPGTADASHGYWRRVIVLEFNRRFSATDNAEPRADILRRLNANQAGFVAKALRLSREALQRNALVEPPSSVRAKAEWKLHSNPVAQFIAERFQAPEPEEKGDAAHTSSTALFDEYQRWAKRNGHPQTSHTAFGLRLKALNVPKSKTSKGVRYRVVPRRYPHHEG